MPTFAFIPFFPNGPDSSRLPDSSSVCVSEALPIGWPGANRWLRYSYIMHPSYEAEPSCIYRLTALASFTGCLLLIPKYWQDGSGWSSCVSGMWPIKIIRPELCRARKGLTFQLCPARTQLPILRPNCRSLFSPT